MRAEVSLRRGSRHLSLGRPRYPKLIEEISEEEGISQRKSSRDLPKGPFEYLAKYPTAHIYGETPGGQEVNNYWGNSNQWETVS